jgi:hypothetical protein
MVESDYKNNRVSDPTKIATKQIKAIKKYVVDFFNKAVKKRRDHEKQKREKLEAEKKAAEKAGSTTPPAMPIGTAPAKPDDDEDIQLSDDEMMMADASDEEDMERNKRKRESQTPASPIDGEESIAKKLKVETPPAPPPPPPPAEDEEMETDEGATTPTQEVPEPVKEEWEGEQYHDEDGGKQEDDSIGMHSNGSVPKEYRGDVQLATPSTNGTYEHDIKMEAHQKAVAAGGE